MAELDFTNLWDSAPPAKTQETPQDTQDSNKYTALKNEYQQYIQFNKELEAQRRQANHDMIQLLKDCKEGEPSELLEDSLKIIGDIMRDKAFYTRSMANFKENPNKRQEGVK